MDAPAKIGEFEQTLHPRDYLDHWPAWGRLPFKTLGGHAGENREWSDIDSWAEKISREIRPKGWAHTTIQPSRRSTC